MRTNSENVSLRLSEYFDLRARAYGMLRAREPELMQDSRGTFLTSELIKSIVDLLENSADVNAQGRILGNTLQAASIEGNKEVVVLLLERGADVNA